MSTQNFLKARATAYSRVIAFEHARRLLETENIDLALVDIRFIVDDDPDDVSGLTVVVDEQFRNQPKIVLTNYPSTDTMRLALRPQPNQPPPAVGYLEKRKGFTDILRAIENAFKRDGYASTGTLRSVGKTGRTRSSY